MMSSTNIETNPWLQHEALPLFEQLTPSDLTPAVDYVLQMLETEFQALEAKLQASMTESSSNNNHDVAIPFDEVVPVMEKMQFPLDFAWSVAGHLKNVVDEPTLRSAYKINQPKIVASSSKLQQSKVVYNALSAIAAVWKQQADNPSKDELSFEESQQRRVVELSLRDMTLGGVGFDGAEKDRFNDIKVRLAALATTFSSNVLDETKAYSLTIEDAAVLGSVPASAKAMWASAHALHLQAQAKKSKEEAKDSEDSGEKISIDPEQGPWRITLDIPSYLNVMRHLPDRSIRQQVYIAYAARASESNPEKNNIPLIYETLKLRAEMAQMLGFKNYAEVSLSRKMAPSVRAIKDLTDLVLEKALPAAEKELEEVTAFARAHGGEEYNDDVLPKLMPWDITFWSERLKETKFDLTEEQTRPYFALPAVLDGLFSLVERIFDIRVKAADGDSQVWHPDVRFFHVFEGGDSSKHLASFYLDPYSRPENKNGGAWMSTCINKSVANHRDIPVAILVCNGTPPVGEKPSLMTFREVETLIHEFGHGLQHMLTTATLDDVAGIHGIEWDAVELPSQFMENWCYDKATIYGFAKHWETGEPLPEDMFQKLCEQKTFGAGMMTCRQLLFGQLDLELHSNYDPVQGEANTGETILDVHRRMAEKYTPFNMPVPEDRFLCAFSHIFAGGYAAGYYSYIWAEVMSSDAFGAFEECGLDNEEQIRKVGRSFRNTVLSCGGAVDPMTVYKRFRGRPPNPDAMLRHKGLA